jgi:hypothetical protein
VHTAWSGNHTHYAERLFTGTQVIGGERRALGWDLPADGGDGLVLPGGSAGLRRRHGYQHASRSCDPLPRGGARLIQGGGHTGGKR